MILKATCLILSKKRSEYTARDGQAKQAYRVTISQEDNSVIAELPLNEEIYQALEKNKSYDLECIYRVSRNGGNYLMVLSAKPSKPLL